ncbi:beta-glucanase [Diaporthe helianthi]|uniref:Beta-glucanase n=1 Tax=Diaporthe helianthi TaxID=158607 RepID=A0A2P5IA70_DIAHE|nr:beta-glucanase [Diaporthe helianthi]
MGYSKVLAILSAAGLPLAQAAVPTIEGFTLTCTANWIFSTGTSYPGGAANWGTGEIQTYTSGTENLALTGNGTLCITTHAHLSGSTVPSPAMQSNYLTYTVEVVRTTSSAEAINWHLGDTIYHTVTAAQVGDATVWADAVHGSVSVLLNLAIGGSFPNKVYGSTTPIASTASSGTMLVDYVAVYNSA